MKTTMNDFIQRRVDDDDDEDVVNLFSVTTRDGLVEKFAGNETQMECFGRDHLNTSYTTKWLKRGIPDVLHVGDLFHFRKPGKHQRNL